MTLQSQDLFECKTNHITMRKAACVRRQTDGVRIDSSTWSLPESCKDCEQGRENYKFINSGIPEFTLTEIINREDKEMPKAAKGICENCKRPDMALKHHAAHGDICASCYSSVAGIPQGESQLLALKEKAAKYAGKTKMRKSAQGGGSPKVPKAKKQKVEKPARISPEKTDGVIGKLIDGYNAQLDKALAIMTALHTLKEFGAEVEMPTRKIVG